MPIVNYFSMHADANEVDISTMTLRKDKHMQFVKAMGDWLCWSIGGLF